MIRIKTSYKILLFLLGFLAVVISAGFLAQHYLNDRIRDLFVKELNQYLVSKAEVKEIKLSIFRDFPMASVRFSGITIKEAVDRHEKSDLLKADQVSLRFALTDLFKDKFTVTEVIIRNAALFMQRFENGKDNYHFWKPAAGKGSDNLAVDLQRISVKNSTLSYKDISAGQDINIRLIDALFKGKFSSDEFVLSAASEIFAERIMFDSVAYLNQRKVGFNAQISINSQSGTFRITKGELSLNDLKLSANGWIIERKDKHELDLGITTSEATLEELISTIPARYLKTIENYHFDGRSIVAIHLKGAYSRKIMPAVLVDIDLREGTIGKRGTDVKLENVSLALKYSAGQDRTNENLSISGIRASIRNGSISGNVSLKGIRSTYIKANLLADIDLEDLYHLLNVDTIRSMGGKLNLDGRFEGMISDIDHPSVDDLTKCRLGGRIRVSDGTIGFNGHAIPVSKLNGSVVFNNNDLALSKLDFIIGKSDFSVKGTVSNFISWLLVKNQRLSLKGEVYSGRTDWDELSENSSGSGEYSFQLPGDITLDKLHLNVKNFSFRKFRAASISADISMANRILSAQNILMQSMKGTVSGKGSLNASNPAYSIIQCKALFTKVNVKSLFAEFGNFGNTDLTSENLDGNLTADVIYASTMFPNLEMDLASVKTHANIRVENGRLVNYEPMNGLSKFLRVEDLADIRFETLQNQVDISNKIIYIPEMQIKSSAIDLNLMGTHTFGNEIDYHFSLALADLLAAKFRKRNVSQSKQSEFGPIEEDGRGRTMVYVSMTGTVDDPVFSYDKKAVREKISEELKNQKTELKEAFRKEFRNLGDTLKKAEKENEKKMRKKQEDGQFIFEWDDDKKIENN